MEGLPGRIRVVRELLLSLAFALSIWLSYGV